MLSQQLCQLVTWGRREPVALDFAEHGRRQGRCFLTIEGKHRTGFSQVFNQYLWSTHFVPGIVPGVGNCGSDEHNIPPALLEVVVWWMCPDTEPRVLHAHTRAVLSAGISQLVDSYQERRTCPSPS